MPFNERGQGCRENWERKATASDRVGRGKTESVRTSSSKIIRADHFPGGGMTEKFSTMGLYRGRHEGVGGPSSIRLSLMNNGTRARG